MTIAVTDLTAGPWTPTGAAQNLPFTFKVYSTEGEHEVEVFQLLGVVETVIHPDNYTVNVNTDVVGAVTEGGSIDLLDGAAVVALGDLYVRATPSLAQGQIWTDTGSRLKNLNEALDRMVLRHLSLREAFLAQTALSPTTTALEAAAQAQADRVLAEAAAEATAADAVTTGADAAAAALSAANALASELLAAGYISAIPPDVTYETEADGRAAVADGAEFWLRTANGLQMYTRVNAGTSTPFLVSGSPLIIPSLRGVLSGVQDVWCKVTAFTDANNYTIAPVSSNVILTGDGTQYRYHWLAPANNIVGSYNINITQNSGSPYSGVAVNVKAENGVDQVALGAVQQYRKLSMQRNPGVPLAYEPGPANAWRLIGTSDQYSQPIADASLVALKTPKPQRPVATFQMTSNLTVVKVRLDEFEHYDTVNLANQSDHLFIGWMDVREVMGLTTTVAPSGFMALNSLIGHGANTDIEIGNFMFKALDSGTTVETGLVWTAFENVLIAGDLADAGAPLDYAVNYQLTGRAHGFVQDIVTTRRGYRKDGSVGTPQAATLGAALTVTVNTISQAVTGERIRFSGVVGMTQINNVWLTITGVAYVSNTTVFTFAGTNSSGYTAFVSCATPGEREIVGIGNAALNNEWNGLRVTETCSYLMKSHDNSAWGRALDVTTFNAESGDQILVEWSVDHGDAAVVAALPFVPATRAGGYNGMCGTTGMNRAVGYVNGVQGAVQDIDRRDGSNTLFGFAEKVVVWNADYPEWQLEIANISGAGFTHLIDGTPQAYTAQVFIANNEYGGKLYWPINNHATPVTVAGEVHSGGTSYNFVRRAPIT